MPNLSLDRFPYTLKALICSSLELEDSLKLLKTNRELRHHILHNGPFPRKIKELDICVSGPQIKDNRLLFDKLIIRLFSAGQCFDLFRLVDHREPLAWVKYMDITQEDLRLFKKVHYVRDLNLRLYERRASYRTKITDIAKHLPKFRFISDLEVWTDEIGYLPAILANLPAKVDQRFDLFLRSNNENREDLGGREICEFFSKNLADCQEINLTEIRRFGSRPSLYAALQKTNSTKLTLSFKYGDDFWPAVEGFLKIGAPSRNRRAEIEIRGSRIKQKSADFEYSEGIDEFLRSCAEKIDDSVEVKRILAKFASDERETVEITVFRRQLDENLRIFYVFRRFTESMKFHASVERS